MAGCFCFANPSGFLFGPSQKGTICSSELRKICVTGLFSSKCIHSFQAVRMKEIRSAMKDIKIKAQEGKVVDLDFQLSLVATNIMTEMAFGKR